MTGKAGHDLFVYGSLQDPQVVYVLLNRVPDHISAVLSGFHRFRIKNRLYPTILPDSTGQVTGKVLKGITDDERQLLDEFEDVEYDRKSVEVVLTDTSEKLQVGTYVWRNKDDPDLYGEWDFEEWKRDDSEAFITATKKFVEERKLPEAKTRIDTFKTFFQQDTEDGKPLDSAKVDEDGNVYDAKDGNLIYFDKDGEDREINISSAICFLRGKAYGALQNRSQARQWYKAAIKADPLCYEALECLIESHMLTSEEESNLLSSLQFSPEDRWLSSFYSCLIKKYDKESTVEARFKKLENEISGSVSGSSMISTLVNNTDLLACKAEYYHQCCQYQKCFELTAGLLEKDPFHLKCTLVHLAAAMELGNSNELYLMACNLVKDYPSKALSWFAVGCYYYCIKKYAEARRYFSKATNIDGSFSPAWIGFGNSFAAQEEGDQAMSAYRTAARLFPGCHLPTLYIGMEYMRTHSYKLADQFFMQAKAICPSDPLVYNELGVVAYHMKEYGKAVRWFEKTLAHIPSVLTEIWEPTVVNIAHAYRKLRKYREAISYYERALTLSTKSLSTYSGLAYTYHLQGNFSAAISHYHKALWLKPDDQFCTEMLNVALMDECQNGVDSTVELC